MISADEDRPTTAEIMKIEVHDNEQVIAKGQVLLPARSRVLQSRALNDAKGQLGM